LAQLLEDQDLPDSGDEDSDEESGFGYEEDSEEDSALSSSPSLRLKDCSLPTPILGL